MAFIRKLSRRDSNPLHRITTGTGSNCFSDLSSDLFSQGSSESTLPPLTETPPFNISQSQDFHYSETPLSKPELSSLPAILEFAVSKHGDRRCFASRRITSRPTSSPQPRVGTKAPGKTSMTEDSLAKSAAVLGDWEYLTYNEVGEMVLALSISLKIFVGGRLHMFGRNSVKWFMLSHAASMCNTPLVTIYPNCDKWTLIEILLQTQGRVVFVDSDLLGVLSEMLLECPNVSTIIYDQVSFSEEDIKDTSASIASLRSIFGTRLQIMSFGQLYELGRGLVGRSGATVNNLSEDYEDEIPDKERIWGVMYPLSNERREPLGVVITVGNMVASIANTHQILKASTNSSDTYLSYLPLSFMPEYNLVNAFLLLGVTVGFGTNGISYLLSSPHSNLEPGCHGDIDSFEPSILFGIPAWWDMIHGHVLEEIRGRPTNWQELFWKSVEQKTENITDPSGIVSKMTIAAIERSTYLRPIREKFFGARMKWLGVSCSMYAREKREFLAAVLCSSGKMVEVFSFMEMSTMVTFMPPYRYHNNNTGLILPSLQIKLVTVAPDYLAHSSPPCGEIYLRGPSVPCLGYYKNPEATVSAFHDEGWVKTNIIAEWDSYKRCPGPRIIGNVNSLNKRLIGDYVPIESLEAAYRECRLVKDCCIFYSGRQTKPLAVITVNETDFRKFCDFNLPNQTPGMELDEILLSRPVNKLVLNELNVDARSYGIMDFESLGSIILVNDELPTISSAHKKVYQRYQIDRQKVWKIYAAQIEHEFS